MAKLRFKLGRKFGLYVLEEFLVLECGITKLPGLCFFYLIRLRVNEVLDEVKDCSLVLLQGRHEVFACLEILFDRFRDCFTSLCGMIYFLGNLEALHVELTSEGELSLLLGFQI